MSMYIDISLGQKSTKEHRTLVYLLYILVLAAQSVALCFFSCCLTSLYDIIDCWKRKKILKKKIYFSKNIYIKLTDLYKYACIIYNVFCIRQLIWITHTKYTKQCKYYRTWYPNS